MRRTRSGSRAGTRGPTFDCRCPGSPGSGSAPPLIGFAGPGFIPFSTLFPFPGFPGEVRIAAADVNNDGRADVVTSPGPGGSPDVRILDVEPHLQPGALQVEAVRVVHAQHDVERPAGETEAVDAHVLELDDWLGERLPADARARRHG